MSIRQRKIPALRLLGAFLLLVPISWSQQMSNFDRDRAQAILQTISSDVKKHYYDPKFHGQDWDATVSQTKDKIAKETFFNMSMSHIAAALDTLHDSHTFLLPPQHAYRHDYGWQYQIVGDRCFVTRVRPGSDAETKGVKAGDEILTINGYNVNRDDLWKIQYVFSVLRPQPALHMELRDPAGQERKVEVAAKVVEQKRLTDLTSSGATDIWDMVRKEETQEHLMRARYFEEGDRLMVLKVPEFAFSLSEVDTMIDKARKHQSLIIDLRGNPGGSVDTLKYLVGGMFDHEVKVADRVGRKESKPEVAKSIRNTFNGKLIVLVDSRSASAAEMFARIMQLEGRGTVLGDHSSGSVMEARHYNEKLGTETMIFFGASVTEWDLIMKDGKSLERNGVTPDQLILPTAQDLASGRDPVLAQAAGILGVTMTPETAGKAFPFEWPPI
jgi:C-terminal processing protease CtpA/Prc